MRILFVSNYYPPFEVGGYEQLCRDVCERLAALGHETAVLTSDHGVRSGESLDQRNVHRTLRILPQYDRRPGPAWQFFVARRRTEAYNQHCLGIVVDEFGPEAIFIWNLEGLPHELALDAEALPHVGVAYWVAGRSPAGPDRFWSYWTRSPAKRISLACAKRILARVALAQMRSEGKPARPLMRHTGVVSDFMLQQGQAKGTLPETAQVIYNGVETDLFFRTPDYPPAESQVQLLLAGRVSRDKGTNVAVDSVGKLAQARPGLDFRLLIAGRGTTTYIEELRELARSHRVQDRVDFLGWVPRERMPELMHRSHILLLPTTHQEPFARVILEAMAAGLAVVGTKTGGTSEILVDGDTGLTCRPGDSGDMARQIERLLDDPQLRLKLASRGQRTVLEKYSLQHMVDRLQSLLKSAVQEKPGEGRHDVLQR